jgi:uncharacterized protein (TIGR02466 family)
MEPVRELLTRAFEALRAGQPDAAIAHARAALAAAPDDVDAHLLLADALRRRGDAAAGVAALRALSARVPERFDLCFNLGVLADAAGDAALAVESYQRAAALRPAAFEPLHNLGQALARVGDHAAALDAHSRALALAPQHPELQLAHASAVRAAGDAPRATALLEALLATRPGDPRLWNQLGIARRETGALDAAAAAYAEALRRDARHADAWHNLATLEAGRDALDAAHAAARQAVESRPGFVAAWLNLAAIELRRGARDAARAAVEQALVLAPRLARAHLQRATVLSWSFDRAELADAERSAAVALELGGVDAEAWSVTCVVARKLGAHERAIAAGRAAFRLAPGVAEHALHLADALLETGASAEAATALAGVAAATAPAAVHRQLGIAQLTSGAAGAARAALERAADLDPGDQRTTAWRIAACQSVGDFAAARRLHDMDRFIRPVQLPVPPGYADGAAFRAALAHDIQHHPSLRYEPVGLAAVGGSLAQDLLSARTPSIDAFEQALRAAITAYQDALTPDAGHPFLRAIPRRYRLQMWATLLDGGGEIATHIHEESWLSGAFYVRLPAVVRAADAARSGWIEFGRPAWRVPGLEPELRVYQPEEGLLLLFPSYLHHRTLPFDAAGELRISISFDLTPEPAR